MRSPDLRNDPLGRRLRQAFAGVRRARPSSRVRRRLMADVRRMERTQRSPSPTPQVPTRGWEAPPVIRLAAANELIWERGRLAIWWLAL